MEVTSLRTFLQSLCRNSPWNYAVFWKLQQESQMILKWEDGCYDHPKPRAFMDSKADDMGFSVSETMFSSSWGSSRHDGHSAQSPLGQVMANMASIQYLLGEGVVGEVAYTGNYSWILCENLLAVELRSKVVPECPDEWLLQAATGIKTIVLIPISPHGVLQLGSSKKVVEDTALVALVRGKFYGSCNNMDFLPSSMGFEAQNTSLLTVKVMDSPDGLSTTTVNQMKYDDPEVVFSVNQTSKKLSCTNCMMPQYLLEDAHYTSREDMRGILNSTRENSVISPSFGLNEVPKPLDQSLHDIESELFDSSMIGSFSVEDLKACSYSSNYNVGMFGEHANVNLKSYGEKDVMVQPFVDDDAVRRVHQNLGTMFSFPMDCELHKALGPTFLHQNMEYPWDSSVTCEDSYNSSSQLLHRDFTHDIEPLSWETSGWLVNRHDADQILEAVIATMNSNLNDDLSQKPNDVKLSVKSLGQFSASTNVQSQSEEYVLVEEKGVPRISMTIREQNTNTKSPPPFSSESTRSTLTVEQEEKKCYNVLQTRKGSKPSTDSRKRARPGESQRPRPRDRQLIQDRVKELRELVPNGSKCSIDGLLDITIKHLLFLKSVTGWADKLKNWVNQEMTGQKKMRSSSTKCDGEKGTSWAFEVGCDAQVCPIVVKDLEYPGHMLIEMLCNDHGLFLEIAEAIRHLELTILKGVMESRANNTWAHFIVEVSMGFHRLDIFWPLMQLLQQNQPPISNKT